MGTLYHYGDSYATTGNCDIHFVKELANRMKYNYIAIGTVPGGSNEQILSKLLSQVMDIKKGDMLFFNFSFFTRGSYYDRELGKIASTNSIYNENDRRLDISAGYIMDIVSYQLDYNEDYNRRLFHQYDILFQELNRRRIPVYYIFIERTEFSDGLLEGGYEIKFPGSFYEWLSDNGYNKEQCCHYTQGVQGIICDYVVDKISEDKKKLL